MRSVSFRFGNVFTKQILRETRPQSPAGDSEMKRERKNQIESIGTNEYASIEQCFIAGIERSVEAKQALDQQRLCHRAGIPYLGLGALRNLLAQRSSSDLCIH